MSSSESDDSTVASTDSFSIGKITWGLIIIGLLAVGGTSAWFLATTGPTAQKGDEASEERAPRVEVTGVKLSENNVTIQGYGSVEAARKIKLVPQVSGKITDRSDSFHPGGFFDRGDSVVQIDPADYQIAVQQRQSELQQAKSELKITQSDQDVARDEYQRISDQFDIKNPGVVLKKPQIRSSKAAVRKARSALEQAKLNLDRASLEAPFDAHVTRRNVEVGMSVSTGQTLATLVGTDEYWVKLSISVSKLNWLTDNNGNLKKKLPVKIYNGTSWEESTYRNAYVKDLIRELETEGRMAQVLVAIKDPLAIDTADGKPSMMVGSYVRGVIEADTLPESVRLDRDLIRDGDKVWVATAGGNLDIRDVTVVYRGEEHVIVSGGLETGDQVINTDLSSPVDGMAVVVRNGNSKEISQAKKSSSSHKSASTSKISDSVKHQSSSRI